MRLIEVWESATKPTISFEFFPARTEKAEGNLKKTIDKLAALNPDFVSVTFGAGGSTREGSLELVRSLKRDRGLEVVAYFAGYGLAPEEIVSVEVRQGIAALPKDDKKALVDFGIEFALEQCRELLKAGVPGLHFYTMDRSKSTVAIVNGLKHQGLI